MKKSTNYLTETDAIKIDFFHAVDVVGKTILLY